MALNLGEGDLRVALAVRNLSLASAGDIAAVQAPDLLRGAYAAPGVE